MSQDETSRNWDVFGLNFTDEIPSSGVWLSLNSFDPVICRQWGTEAILMTPGNWPSKWTRLSPLKGSPKQTWKLHCLLFKTPKFLRDSKMQSLSKTSINAFLYRDLLNTKCNMNKQHKNIMIIIIIYKLRHCDSQMYFPHSAECVAVFFWSKYL